MSDLRSRVTGLLRRTANILPANNPIRRFLSRGWSSILGLTGRSVAMTLGGRSIRLGNKYRHLDPNYEAETLALWNRLLEPGDTVWDVGANIGVYSVLSGMAVGPNGRVVCWEPTPGSYSALCEQIAFNGLEKICRAENSAIGDTDGGSISFRVSSQESDPTNRIALATNESTGHSVTVPIGTLDGWLTRLGAAPRVVKIDIEGAEMLALRGAAHLLGPGGPRPLILLAVHPMFLPEFGSGPAEVAERVRSYDYRAYTISGEAVSSMDYAEYLLVPEERSAAVVTKLGWKAG